MLFPDAILMIDENSRLTWFNNAAGVLLDLRGQEDIGRPVSNLVQNTRFNNWLTAWGEVKDRIEIPAPGKENNWLDVQRGINPGE